MEYEESISFIKEKVPGKNLGKLEFCFSFFLKRTVTIKVVSINGGRIIIDGNSGTTHAP